MYIHVYNYLKKIFNISDRKIKISDKNKFFNKSFSFFPEQRIKVKFELILVLSYENKVQTLVITLLLVTFNQNV